MNFKIIETDSISPDVLLHRGRNEEGVEVVRILAIGMISNEPNMFVEDEIEFSNPDSAKNFIYDFSIESANEFCKREGIKYE